MRTFDTVVILHLAEGTGIGRSCCDKYTSGTLTHQLIYNCVNFAVFGADYELCKECADSPRYQIYLLRTMV